MQMQVFVTVQVFVNTFLTDLLYTDICHKNCLGERALSGYLSSLLPIFLSLFFFFPQAFNKNNLILEERNKYFNPHLTAKTYSNTYFTDFNNYDEY